MSAGAALGGARAVLPLPADLLQGDEVGQARSAEGRRQFGTGCESVETHESLVGHGRGVYGDVAPEESEGE